MASRAPDPVPPTPQQQAELAGIAARLDAAAHGSGGAIAAAAAADLGISLPTLHAWLKPFRESGRQRRSDAGVYCLSRAEALQVAAVMEGRRQNGKRTTTLVDAVSWLRANGLIAAERIDPASGEILPLSESAIARALRAYGMHHEQLEQPTPHVNLSSPHPNYCWQVDASVCVVFYLPDGGVGLCELDEAVHYKNKPENLKAIEAFRVIRYVGTDHCSGAVRFRYYPHAESGAHTLRHLAWMMAPKASPADPFHGAPLILMVDPGATSSGLVRRFCRRLSIRLIVNKPRNPRAKGQVEQGNNLVETKFESGLKYQRDMVRSFEDLNRLADVWQLHFNASETHRRHGKTRFGKWLEIRADQLRTTGSAEMLLALATDEPKTPTVDGDLSIRFMGRRFDVRHVPGVTVKGKVEVHWHPFIAETAMAITQGADGQEVHVPLPEIKTDEHGFPQTAVQIGSGFHAQADTVLETNRKEVLKLATGEARLGDAEKVRRGREYVPLGGELDPFKTAKEAPLPTYLPRAGTPLALTAPTIAARTVTVTRAALHLRERLNDAWRPEFYDWLEQRYPQGIGEDQLERLAEQWSGNGAPKAASAGGSPC